KPRPTLSRDYWRLWWANAVSSTGDGAFAAALPLLAVTITRVPWLVSMVTALVIARQVDIVVLCVAGLLLGSAEVIFSNAAQSVLPALVPPELLPKANGRLQVSLTVGESFLGPPAGSLLFAVAAVLPFGLDAASFAGSAALLARLPRQAAPDPERPKVRLRAQIGEGLRWLTSHHLLRIVAVLLGVSNFAG